MALTSRNRPLQILFIAVLATAVGCARQPDASLQLALSDRNGGCLLGVFHGFTMLLNIVASLFFDVRIYAFPNSGRLYDLGYVVGALAFAVFADAAVEHVH